MYYDLHIHSCLSPCADDDMTPNNICNMAFIKGLDVIAITDHNSCRNLPAFDVCAKNVGIKLIYGCELQTIEEVHVLGLFQTLAEAMSMQEWIDEKLKHTEFDPAYFGNELEMNEKDEVIQRLDHLLIISLDATIDVTIDAIHSHHGSAVLAHAAGRTNSICVQLGFIPKDLPYDAIEVKKEEDMTYIKKIHPWITDDNTLWLMDSDAHRLVDIHEQVHSITDEELRKLWSRNL
jgi:predicted metal-dependent phosphoesterase TrpH